MSMKCVCVFCGSSSGEAPEYVQAAKHLGTLMAQQKQTLVFGGGKVGMMGQLAKAALEAGGEVIGVIPRWLAEKQLALKSVSDLRIVDTMHERKQLMAALADGFIALPGGIGTLEEFFEVWTWAQLGLHQKPCGLLNVCGYYSPLLGFVDHMVEQRFIEATHRQMVLVEDQVERLLERMETYQAPKVDKAAWALRLEAV